MFTSCTRTLTQVQHGPKFKFKYLDRNNTEKNFHILDPNRNNIKERDGMSAQT